MALPMGAVSVASGISTGNPVRSERILLHVVLAAPPPMTRSDRVTTPMDEVELLPWEKVSLEVDDAP